jgi:hypothetical protein
MQICDHLMHDNLLGHKPTVPPKAGASPKSTVGPILFSTELGEAPGYNRYPTVLEYV